MKILSSRRCASSDGLSRDAGLGAAWRQSTSTVSARPAAPQPPPLPPARHAGHADTSGAMAKALPTPQPVVLGVGTGAKAGGDPRAPRPAQGGCQRIPRGPWSLLPHTFWGGSGTVFAGVGRFSLGCSFFSA